MADASATLPARGPHRARPSSRIPTTSRWPAAARSPAWPTPASASSCSARRAAKRGSVSDPALVPRRRSRRACASASCARPPRSLGIADVIVLDHPDGDLRWDDVPGAPRGDRRGHRALPAGRVITFAEDGLYWHLDHIGVHERTYTAVRSLGADAPPLYYVTMPHGVMREVVEAAHAKGGRAARLELLGHRARRVRRRRQAADASSIDVRDWVPRKLAALRCHRTQMGPEQSVRLDRRGRGAALARRRAVPPRADSTPPANPMLEQLGEPVHPCRLRRSTSSAARTAAAGSTSSTSLFHRAQRRRDPRRHPRLPLLHLPGRRRHSGAAPAAGRRPRRAISIEAGPARIWRAARCSASTTTAQAERVRRASPRPTPPPTATPSRRSGRTSKAAISSTASPIPTYIVGARGGPRRRRGTVLARRRPRDRHLRRLGASDAVAARSVVAAAGARRSVLREDLAGAPLHRARAASRSAATATRRCRSRAARSASRCAPTRSCTSGRSGSSSARWRGWSTTAATPGAVLISHTHNQRTWSPSHGQPLSPDGYARSVRDARAAALRRGRAVRRRRRRRPARSVARGRSSGRSTPIRR